MARATLASQALRVKITRHRKRSPKGEADRLSVTRRARLRIAASRDRRAIRMYFRCST
tara:strand:+ start:550 stop:723 length:174 start_codon:yes stop_codon:yes gene_type:complete